jgi:hypothetical protein
MAVHVHVVIMKGWMLVWNLVAADQSRHVRTSIIYGMYTSVGLCLANIYVYTYIHIYLPGHETLEDSFR